MPWDRKETPRTKKVTRRLCAACHLPLIGIRFEGEMSTEYLRKLKIGKIPLPCRPETFFERNSFLQTCLSPLSRRTAVGSLVFMLAGRVGVVVAQDRTSLFGRHTRESGPTG